MCETYREYFIETMKKKGESFEDVIGYVGKSYGELDEPVLEQTDAYAPEEEISLHVYTKNWVYSLRHAKLGLDIYWTILALPLPSNPEFKHIVFS